LTLDEARVRQAHATAQLLITMAVAVLEVGFRDGDPKGQQWVDDVVTAAQHHAGLSTWQQDVPASTMRRIGEVLRTIAEGALAWRTLLGGP